MEVKYIKENNNKDNKDNEDKNTYNKENKKYQGFSPLKELKELEEEKEEENTNLYYEFYETVKDLLESEIVQQMKKYPHHCETTCYQHCVNVAYYNYKICKQLNLDAVSAARAGILHDLFLYDWRTHAKETGKYFHALTHPKTALKNAKKYFELNELEEEIILKHMWPVTFIPPKKREAFIITLTDKYCGFFEIADFFAKHYTPGWLNSPFDKIHVR